ncbi:2-oxoglutarate dehydrogenase complex dihydrolipoyllysine-residue succinyltransferase [Caldalkalibacillus salinus]|uniref:2-oxoglutarate dehydrogenase complex dihydrolipoyllysine-residue succinyltransferase n=1 Tax=Caldalkalibacillus salinus TaxID=2803787 RepID=UPI001923F6BE|nr:2-oxoglutarate dehydrogenase complex dihydrolipoyllysine-residue succinyltransferase [Caldalkalibacillus salinus]
MIEIKVPELGESITEGTISQWVVQPGDHVSAGDIVCELETDKVNMEVMAEHDGIIGDILKQAEETVEVGDTIATLEEAKEANHSTRSQTKAQKNDQHNGSNNAITQDDQLKHGAKDTESVHKQDKEGKEIAEENEVETEGRAAEPAAISPAARKLARDKGIDLKNLPQDPMGRVTLEDVQSYMNQEARSETEQAHHSQPEDIQVKDQANHSENLQNKTESVHTDRPIERQRMSRRRQTIANHLVQAQQQAAMLTTFNEVDMSAIMAVRKRRKDAFKDKYDVNLGFMSFFTKAVIGALKDYPLLNAEIQGNDILIKKFYDIGVAVSAKEGLVVPVVRHADRLNFAQIEKEIATLAQKARDNTLSLEDIQGGTFTITNGGVFGSLFSTPILNAPQVGILGMHTIQKRPVAIDDDHWENRPMMYIALSYDHRIVDGRDAVSFLVKVKTLLEDPETLLLEG